MNSKIVWRKFYWQKFGRFWLYYEYPNDGWRHTDIHNYFKVKKQVLYRTTWLKGFNAGVGTYKYVPAKKLKGKT